MIAMAAGPVGGTGAGTGGDRARAPRLALGLPDGTMAAEPARPATDGDGRAASAAGAGRDAAVRATLPAGDRASLRAAAAELIRLLGSRPWLELLLSELFVPDRQPDDGGPRSEEVIPGGDEQDGGTTAATVAGLVVLAGVVGKPVEARRRLGGAARRAYGGGGQP
jgi:hypothetical protein